MNMNRIGKYLAYLMNLYSRRLFKLSSNVWRVGEAPLNKKVTSVKLPSQTRATNHNSPQVSVILRLDLFYASPS